MTEDVRAEVATIEPRSPSPTGSLSSRTSTVFVRGLSFDRTPSWRPATGMAGYETASRIVPSSLAPQRLAIPYLDAEPIAGWAFAGSNSSSALKTDVADDRTS